MRELNFNEIEKINQLHEIYSNEIPVFIKQIIEAKEMQRIRYVGQNCGRDYISYKLQTFEYNYSRLDHSIGVGLIVWNFTKDITQSIAGLLHDIAAPTFSHVIDFYNNDEENQTSTELGTEDIIKNSIIINKVTEQYGINIEDVVDYAMYPIADNSSPKLSADRLEYNLYMGTSRKIITMDEAKEIYQDIVIMKNEEQIDEMCFKNIDIARKFTKLALDNGEYMSGGVSTITNKLLSDVLKLAASKKVITAKMFYENDEETIVNILNQTNDIEVSKSWEKFKNFEEIYISNEKVDDRYNIENKSKKRYINPLVQKGNTVKRITDINSKIKEEIEEFINPKNNKKYFYI